jgi:hypothetical protein
MKYKQFNQTIYHSIHNVCQPTGTLTTRRTLCRKQLSINQKRNTVAKTDLSTRFVLIKVCQTSDVFDHIGLFVHHNHCRRSQSTKRLHELQSIAKINLSNGVIHRNSNLLTSRNASKSIKTSSQMLFGKTGTDEPPFSKR